VDLAGSESAKRLHGKARLVEGSFINRSLLTLGMVIRKLASGG
jgi:centromeric protein E